MVISYQQLQLNKQDKDKTAFTAKQGHWVYRRLPMGLKTAGATFQ
jgi:hypothetical protein